MDYQSTSLLTVSDFSGGVNYAEEPHKISDHQLSDLCNLEYKNGVLAKRSGYETLLTKAGVGEILAAQEFRGEMYFACTNAMVRVNPVTNAVTILARDLQLEKPGSFVIKENLMYYFSGKGIYKMNPFLSSFGVEAQDVFPTSAVCELEPGIYTDGNTVADFNECEVASYSLGNETVDFDFICCRGTTVYGVKKPSALNGNTTVTILSLVQEEGVYTLQSRESVTAVMPLHDPYQYVSYKGIYIRYMDALPDALYLQCDYIVSTSNSSIYDGFMPLVMRFNLQTKEFETDCGISNATACYELYSRFDDTVMLLRQDAANSKSYFILRRDGTDKQISLSKKYIAYDSSGSSGKQHMTHLTAVSEDMAVVTYLDGSHAFHTELWKVTDTETHVLATTNEVIDDLCRIGNNFYALPVWRAFYENIGLSVNEWVVTPYYFGDGRIERGYPYVSDKRETYSLSAFGSGKRLISSENSAVCMDGYVPVILTAMYVSDTEQYETVYVESYNSLSAKARVQFVEKVDTALKTIELPIPYSDVASISSTRGSDITFAAQGQNILVTSSRSFILGEELIVISKDTGTHNAVKQCNLAVAYDMAEDGTRIFAAGNGDFPAVYYVSETDNFEYFPEQNYQLLSDGGQQITGFARHYQELIVFKDKSISMMGDTLGNVSRVHDTIGCDMPGSIQIVNNDVVFGNSEKGLFLLSVQQLSSERNVQPIGLNISGKRGIGQFSLQEKQQAVSLDFQNRYFLAVGDRVYLWDYALSPYGGVQQALSWFEYRHINASCLFAFGETMAFGQRGQFALNLFNGSCNDNGQAIPTHFQTKAFDFGDSTALKAVHQLWMSMDGSRDMEITLECVDEKQPHNVQTLSFRKKRMANTLTRRLKLKRVLFCGVQIGNCQTDTAYDVSGIKLEFQIYKSRR